MEARAGIGCGRVAAALLALAFCGVAQAKIFWVGAAPCEYQNLQEAVDAARVHVGDADGDIIRVTTASWTEQAIRINEVEDLIIDGGWHANCSGFQSGQTIIDGSGGAAAPVIAIQAPTGVRVTLKNLAIMNGDATGIGTSYGGGVYFAGDGIVHLTDTWVVANRAAYGGGISAKGTGPNAELILGNGTLVGANEARYSGGGVLAESLKVTMEAAVIQNNAAVGEGNTKGYGGGLKLVGNDYPANAYIRSTANGAAIIFGNSARYGGGIAVETRKYHSDTRVHIYTTNPERPAIVQGNVAKVAGGGFYAEPSCDSCWGTAVNVWDTNILNNSAPKGAVAYLDWYDATFHSNKGSNFHFNDDTLVSRPANSVRCRGEVPCNQIMDNRTVDSGGSLADGAIIHGVNDSVIRIGDALLRGNRGGRVVYGNRIRFDNALVIENETTAELVMADDYDSPPALEVNNSTFANNTIGSARVLYVGDGGGSTTELARTILWQPGKTSLRADGTLTMDHVLASELGSLGNFATLTGEPPRFIDPENGNYRLQPGSVAVDFAPALDGHDIDGMPRSIDLPHVFNKFGPTDLGPYERQNLEPLLYNDQFKTGLDAWKEGAGSTLGATAWDPTRGIGSARVEWVFSDMPTPLVGRQQCVYLPDAGLYRLSGLGRTEAEAGQGQGDDVVLYWEFRKNGGKEACTEGPPTARGTVVLGNSTNWTLPAAPAYINVPLSEFTIDSSIMVAMMVIDHGSGRAIGWFDDIVLDFGQDGIFADGFD